jgi:integrase
MAKPRRYEVIPTQYFTWRLIRRDRVYYADGRSNQPALGRHSLGTRVRAEAIQQLARLDLNLAVEHGLADRSLWQDPQSVLSLAAGRQLYEEHVNRSPIAGGPRRTTAKRYRAVFDKFVQFAAEERLTSWNQVQPRILNRYTQWLEEQEYAPKTVYLELTTLKQVLKFLVEQKHLPPDCGFHYSLQKPTGTDRYCWTPTEVGAMVAHCADPELHWLRNVIVMLASTGLRISELLQLEWRDVDFDLKQITVVDDSSRRRADDPQRRTTKSGHSRTIPIKDDLCEMLTGISGARTGRIFRGPQGGRLDSDRVRQAFIRHVVEPLAGEFPSEDGHSGFRDGRLHSFRHYFCSVCANAGIPERVLMAWLGHRDSDLVHHYYHLHSSESQRQMQLVPTIPRPVARRRGDAEPGFPVVPGGTAHPA